MVRKDNSTQYMLRGDQETISLLRGLKNSMGKDEFKSFVRKQYKMHYFFKNLFKQK